MRIFIYYNITDKPWGGGNSFLKAFKNYLLKRHGKAVNIAGKISDKYDIFFMNGGHKDQGVYIDLAEVEKVKNPGRMRKMLGAKAPKIVYRLDGARFRYNKTISKMDDIQFKALSLADFIVFQSAECLDSFRELGYSGQNCRIVSNGVDQSLFNVLGKETRNRQRKLKLLSAAWSSNVHKGFEIISQFSEINGVESHFVGNWCKEVDSKKVIIISPLKQAQLAEYYKSCDVFLHAAENDPCPNVVLEALSCGLPVIYHNSGGTSEFAQKYGAALPEEISPQSLSEAIEQVKKNYALFTDNIIRDMETFSIDYAAEKYLRVFAEVLDGTS